MSRMNAERCRLNVAERKDTVILVKKAWKHIHNMDDFSSEDRSMLQGRKIRWIKLAGIILKEEKMR